ncbi:MAG: UxaA family hydrolase [Ectothiorhodospiraceae bacterium]|nr:UxaA family hydrolase [Ectothiorhodospiraceae bacterium]
MAISAYLRDDGRKGIRNLVAVVYVIECARHVAQRITLRFDDSTVHCFGWSGCYPNVHGALMMERLCTHPNVGAVLIVSLGCEGFDRSALRRRVEASGRPCELLVIQRDGGTAATIERGVAAVERMRAAIADVPRVPMAPGELVVGTICGGSDATSGITANPAMGAAFDLLIADGGIGIFEETGELIGCEHIMEGRAANPALGEELVRAVVKARRFYETLGHGSFSPGNAEGGLTTQEEKSLGAYAKSGDSPIVGILKPGVIPTRTGLYLLDMIPDGEVRHGFPNINDTAEIMELIACGAHMILFSTGRGSVVGSVISPVIKVCGNPETHARLSADMDVNAGRILLGEATVRDVGAEIYALMQEVATETPTLSEALGHQEAVLAYKTFEPLGPACFPA